MVEARLEPWCDDYPACKGGLQAGDSCLACDEATRAYNAYARRSPVTFYDCLDLRVERALAYDARRAIRRRSDRHHEAERARRIAAFDGRDA